MRFADVAVTALLQRMLELGARREHITAKIFGGAALHREEQEYATSLGASNVVAAMRLLADQSIPVVAQDTGGMTGRKIVFHSDEGTAWSKPV
jgi:chemotaxis protein CheD